MMQLRELFSRTCLASYTVRAGARIALLLALGIAMPGQAPLALPPSGGAFAVPAAFVANRGQWPSHVLAAARHAEGQVWLETTAIVTCHAIDDRRGESFRLCLPGSASVDRLEFEAALAHRVSYFRGDEPSAWASGLVPYAVVRLRDLAPGVDLGIRFRDGHPEYFFEIARGARLEALEIRCEGQRELRDGPSGSLVLVGTHGELVQDAPMAFRRKANGTLVPVPARFVRRGDDRFGFEVLADADDALLIDPVLRWASYIGGSTYEWGYGVAKGADGSVVAVGETTSTDFPITPGAFDPTYNGFGQPTVDVYVARFTAAGAIVYATYLGGPAGDRPYAVAVDATGSATVVGSTNSPGFPTTVGAYDRVFSGSSDGFATRLTPDGTALVWSTLLGGSSTETVESLALLADGSVAVVGVTSSPDFPTTAGALQSTRLGTSDGFIARLAADGSQLLAATLLGGASGDVAKGIAEAPDGRLWCAGVTSSANFPTTAGAPQAQLLGNGDAFLACVSRDATTLVASTLCGGSSGETGEGVAVGPDGLVVMVGVTSSSNFPVTAGALQPTPSGNSDAFVVGYAPDLSIRFATLLGGSSGDVAKGVSIDPAGSILVGGQTGSANFPTTPGAFMTSGSGTADAFASHLAADGSGLLASTLFGGSGSDGGEDLSAIDAADVALTGVTNSGNLPVTPGAFSASQQGTNDAFVAVLDLRPAGLAPIGVPSPNCGGVHRISASRRPASGAGDFSLLCTGGVPNSVGVLAISFGSSPGVPVLGVQTYLDLAQPLLTLVAFSDGLGFARAPLPLPVVTAPITFWSQFFWLHPPACTSLAPLSSSDALSVTVQ